MIDSTIVQTEAERNVLVYLKSRQNPTDNLNVEVKGKGRSGVLKIRKGRVIAASSGVLSGNGAILVLSAIKDGEIQSTEGEDGVEADVSISLLQTERILSRLKNAVRTDAVFTEDEKLEEAVSLFYQFRRKEAGSKLIEILRANRFYYPAWLWHSRLMTREDYIGKALGEAKRWGNSDREIKRESEKVTPLLIGSEKPVKRCFFCWAPVPMGKSACVYCNGQLRVSMDKTTGKVRRELLEGALARYERELKNDPGNIRIMYCQCLGFYSLGDLDRARGLIKDALKISPREPLFVKTAALLGTERPRRQKKVVKSAVAPPAAVSPVTAPAPAASVKGQQKTILVVEDSKTSRKVISMLLERKGYRILEATVGAEAFTQTEKIVPDLVLLDVMLPDMSGYDVLLRLKRDSRFAKIPVVMLTGKTGAADRLRGMKSGSSEYLTKPFDPAKLLAVIAKYLVENEGVVPVAAPQKRSAPITAKAPGAAVSAPAASVSKVAEKEKPAVKKAGKILVIEDSPTSRKVISMVLVRNDFEVREAITGVEGLGIVNREDIDLVLLDAMLPDMTGYDVLASMKKNGKLAKTPVIMLTGKKGSADREKGIRAGSVAYLTKPFDPEKLLATIREYL